MVSHLDTVFPPEEEERNNFRWEVEGDRIFGVGGIGHACMLPGLVAAGNESTGERPFPLARILLTLARS